MKRNLLTAALVSCLILSGSVQAQSLESSFEFLKLPVAAHSSSLGGRVVSVYDASPALFVANPALLSANVTRLLGLNAMTWFSGTTVAGAQFSDLFDERSHYAFNARYVSYGKMKETTADAIKIEGGEEIIDSVKRILSAGIPVMGHLGLTPQSIHKFGTYAVRAQDEAEAQKLLRDVHLLEDAGCFAITLEKIPAKLATQAAKETHIPIIGIGAGNGVDGQVLVLHDMLGITNEFSPRFLRRYHHLYEEISGAVENYIRDVKSSDFPNEKEQY